MKKIAGALLALLVLSACDYYDEKTPQREDSPSLVYLVAVAPDGTYLWRTAGGVYFASSGTQFREACGKGCNRKVHVPAALRSPETAE